MSKYPLIILGAGASHDYSPFADLAPPLTNHLVNQAYFNTKLCGRYPESADILSEIGSMLDNEEYSNFEECLTHISSNLGTGSHRKDQLIGLAFYLSDFFELFCREPQFKSRYRTLKSRINDNNGRACVVSFNYDTLFEHALDKNFEEIQDYISGDLKLFKLHGSHDWAYISSPSIHKLDHHNLKDSYGYLKQYPEHLDNLRNGGAYPYHKNQILKSSQSRNGILFNFPAIAIPISKKDHFVCPNDHLAQLKREIPLIDRVLIIGWSGKDPLLIEQMVNLRAGTPVFVVSKDKKEAQETIDNIGEINSGLLTHLDFHPIRHNFGVFMGSQECSDFFESEN